LELSGRPRTASGRSWTSRGEAFSEKIVAVMGFRGGVGGAAALVAARMRNVRPDDVTEGVNNRISGVLLVLG